MTVNETIEKIRALLDSTDAQLSQSGLIKKTKIFFTDKNLAERASFSEDCILLFGDIAIGCADMEEDDYCDFSICVEIKTGLVDDDELSKEIKTFEEEIAAFKSALSAESDLEKVIRDVSEKQAKEAEDAASEFRLEMKKMKMKLYLALGVGMVILLFVLVGSMLLK